MLPLPTSTRFAETGLASSSGRLFRVQHFASTSIASHVVVTRVGIVMDVRDFAIAKTLARSICRELVQVALMVATQLQGSASGTFRFRWSAASARFSLVRYRTVPECAFPSRRGAREVWGNPPPGCGALWRMPQLGKCARATPRQAAGRVARGFAGLGSESGLTERCTLPNRWAAECAFP